MTSFQDAVLRFAALPPSVQAHLVLALLLALALVLAAVPERRRPARRPAAPAPTPLGSLRRARPYAPA